MSSLAGIARTAASGVKRPRGHARRQTGRCGSAPGARSDVAYASPRFCSPLRQPCFRRKARLEPTLARLLSRPNAPPATRLLRDTDANPGRPGRACAFAQQESSRAPRSHECFARKGIASSGMRGAIAIATTRWGPVSAGLAASSKHFAEPRWAWSICRRPSGSREDSGGRSSSRGGRHGICRTAGSCRAPPVSGDPVGLSPGPRAA